MKNKGKKSNRMTHDEDAPSRNNETKADGHTKKPDLWK